MNSESIKLLSEADKKATEEIKKARMKRELLIKEADKKAQEYEQQLHEQKCQEVKKFREKTSNELLKLEKDIENNVADALAKISEKEKSYKQIAETISKLVTK